MTAVTAMSGITRSAADEILSTDCHRGSHFPAPVVLVRVGIR